MSRIDRWTGTTLESRFLERTSYDPETGCWPWTGYLDYKGYPMMGQQGRAHRLAYRLYKGEIPEDFDIDHLCRNPACVNPDHLEAVSHEENVRRFYRDRAEATHCKNGHLLSEVGTYRSKAGGWRCRRCVRESNRRSDARRKAAA